MGEVGGMIASAVGKHIASKLGELVKDEIDLLWGFQDDVGGMKEKMEDLEAVMLDAEERMRRGERDGEAVGRWLAKFKSIAYDVEDMLDELDATELINETQSKLKLFFSRNNQLVQRITIAHNMKTVREKIDKIEREGRQTLNLMRHEGRPDHGSRNHETFAAISSQGIRTGTVGRDVEKEKIIRLLLRSEAAENISIVPIIGLGGLGKSTLAESVLADKRVGIFDIQAWVHVSEHFDLHKIGSSIIKTVNSSVNVVSSSLQFLHDCLKKELAITRYLIVLDDIWEEDGNKLEELKRMLQYGYKGSRIIVTTRNHNVVAKMGTGLLANQRIICPVSAPNQIKLGGLSVDDCWEVIKQRVFGPDEEQGGLEELGRQIADKCGGLPLVANALGHVMSESRTVQAWEKIRDTEINFGTGEENYPLERLKLSYYYMKLEFKMCFTYLAVFPKGYIMDRDRLIQQWNALGYIHSVEDGQRCINYLLGMSFLQVSRSSAVSPSPVHDRAPQELTIHDLVHDLASMIIAKEFLVLDANATGRRNMNTTDYCRHAQLSNYQNQSKLLKDFPTKVRSLHIRDSTKHKLPQIAFSRSKYIRVLDLSGCAVGGKSTRSILDLSGFSVERQSTSSNIILASSIHQLKLLRYLDATGIPIISLPKSFHTLKNIQTLILSNCSLETLPANFHKLCKIYYLDLSCNATLIFLPSALGELSELSFLNLSGCSILEELPESICKLSCLQHLDMSECCSLQKLPDRFDSLGKLIFLNLSNCSKLTKLPDDVGLGSLMHLNLSNCHELENLPHDFGKLQNLVFLNLSGCYKVSMLPESFSQLKHLKYLDLSDCHDLRELPNFFGNLSDLESLNLTSCCKLQLLPESFHMLLKLRVLNLSYCIRLKELPSSFSDLNLELLDISSTSSLYDLPDSIGISHMTSLTQFKVMSTYSNVSSKVQHIKRCLNLPQYTVHSVKQTENSGCSSIVELARLTCCELKVAQLQNVRNPEDAERARLRDKSDLRHLVLQWGPQGGDGNSVLERLVPPRTLECFFLSGYNSKDFPNWMCDISTYLPSLTFISLSKLETCDTLPPFGQLPNLRCLSMSNIPNITKIGKEFYGDGGTCTKLRLLCLKSMCNLVEWWTTQSGEEDVEFLIPNLHEVQLIDCPRLKFLPYPPRSMLWYLDSSDEVLPEGGFGQLSSSTLPFSMNIKKCNFSPEKWDRLEHLPTLEAFEIESCVGLRALPEATLCFTSLTRLTLTKLKDLETLPEWLGQLTSLVDITIRGCPVITSLPESMKNLTALSKLWLEDCKVLGTLPEWIGQLISLEEFNIICCPKMKFLPKSIRDLTTLKELYIWGCPELVKRYKGADSNMISHISKVVLYKESEDEEKKIRWKRWLLFFFCVFWFWSFLDHLGSGPSLPAFLKQ